MQCLCQYYRKHCWVNLNSYYLNRTLACSVKSNGLSSSLCRQWTVHTVVKLISLLYNKIQYTQGSLQREGPLPPQASSLPQQNLFARNARGKYLEPLLTYLQKIKEHLPLECWECDNWIPWTARLPHKHECMKQWVRNSKIVVMTGNTAHPPWAWERLKLCSHLLWEFLIGLLFKFVVVVFLC